MTDARDVALQDVFNLRDLGGYPTADGRVTRWRTLYRGAGLHRLAGADVETVRGLGLRTVVDLRTAGELDVVGSYPVDALPADVHHLPMITAMWDHALIDPDAPAEDYLRARYADMLVEGRTAIAESVRLLARPGALPGVFYCAAGKDRTGVLAALVLSAVGVEDEHVVADYHRSVAHVERIVARARARGEHEAQSAMVAQPAAVMAAPPEAMRLLLGDVRAEHGSAAGFLAACGVADDTLAALREAVLTGAEEA